MDHEKYYVQKLDGSYLIHFPNRNGLSDDKLIDIFSAFGKVLSITNNGKPYGLCYVRYQTLTEVKRSIDGASSSGIRILPHKQKVNEKNVNKTNINRKTNTTMNTEVLPKKNQIEASSIQHKDLPNSSTTETLEHSSASIDISGENDWYPYQTQVDVVHSQKNTSTNTTALSMRHVSDDTLEDHIKVSNSRKDLPDPDLTQSLNCSCTSLNSSCARDFNPYRKKINGHNNKKNAPINTTALSKKDPVALEYQSTVSNACTELSDCNTVLPLFHKSTSSILDSEKSKERARLGSNISNEHLEYTSTLKDVSADNVTHTVTMAEVIVANIHPRLCLFYVLDIFKKYNPLYASTIKRTPVKGIRYCHVYYTDVGDATATVNEFDMADVCGKSLIVFMPCTLLEKSC